MGPGDPGLTDCLLDHRLIGEFSLRLLNDRQAKSHAGWNCGPWKV